MASTRIGPNQYNAAAIEVLESVEPVRRRPGMYIGGTDQRGLRAMVTTALSHALDEHLAGRLSRINVSIDENNWVTLKNDGAGLRVEPRSSSGTTRLEALFTTIPSGGQFDTGDYRAVRVYGPAGGGLAVVNALSRRLEVLTSRDGRQWRAAFERGRTVEAPADVGKARAQGTSIRFLPDPEVSIRASTATGANSEPDSRR